MVELIARSPLPHLPLRIGALLLEETTPSALWLLAPFRQKEQALRAALGSGAPGWPAPGRVLSRGGIRMIWSGPREALWAGDTAPPEAAAGAAAMVAQSDGLCTLRLTGEDVAGCLARLVPVDLRPAAFGRGSAARSLLGHIPALLVRVAGGGVEIFVPRSMAEEAAHEIARAMHRMAGRAALAAR
ncbi:MAG: sarcosine oxidase subunit gamma [Rhodobacteraceae bacterium]|nr:sarcosine oxidase subunit gamma [Paracoccaceae bacterium]